MTAQVSTSLIRCIIAGSRKRFLQIATTIFALSLLEPPLASRADAPLRAVDPAKVLTPEQWQEIDEAVDRGLSWLAAQQRADGSFPAPNQSQPAITSFCVLAFMSRGHLPGSSPGPYRQHLERAIEYILSCQRRDGLFSREWDLTTYPAQKEPIRSAMYNHGITGLVLSELYGMTESAMGSRIATALESAVRLTCTRHDMPKEKPFDEGGWRYWRETYDRDADLSVTSWQLMFLRSAKTAGFDIDSNRIDDALRFVRACYVPKYGAFVYCPLPNYSPTRAMVGAGILCLVQGGAFNDKMVRHAGDWLLAHPYQDGGPDKPHHYYYGLFYAVPAMYQLGGEYWRGFFPGTTRVLLGQQKADGSWPSERGGQQTTHLGPIYTTALTITALNTPNQLLPIMQR